MGQDGQSGLELPRSVRFWLTTLPWGQALLRTVNSDVFQNGSFSSHPAGSPKGFFSSIYCISLVQLLEANFTLGVEGDPYEWVSLWFLTPRVIHTEPPAIHRSQLTFSHPWPGRGVHHDSVHHDFLYLPFCPSRLGGSDFPCILSFLMDAEWVVEFSSMFSSLLVVRKNRQLQAPYLENQKPQVKFRRFLFPYNLIFFLN